MDYWAGATPGSRQCMCGVRGECHSQDKECNCDSEYEDWLEDEGIIKDKKHLPVKSLHFGDTGTPLDNKEGRFSLGRLRCSGPRIDNDDDDDNDDNDDSDEESDAKQETTLATLEIYEPVKSVPSDVPNSTIVEHTEPSRIYPVILSEELMKEEHDREGPVILSISSKFIVICILSFIVFIIIIVFISYVHYCRKTKGEY